MNHAAVWAALHTVPTFRISPWNVMAHCLTYDLPPATPKLPPHLLSKQGHPLFLGWPHPHHILLFERL